MISASSLITKINDLIAAGPLSELEVSQLAKSVDSLERKCVGSVFSLSEIPAADNAGRIVFVENESKYYISNGTSWTTGEPPSSATLYAWGYNVFGQLGDGTIENRSSPVSVVGGFTDWVSVGAGSFHSLAIRANGTLWSWGQNGDSQLGDNTSTNRSSPALVVGGFADWVSVDAGYLHSLGIRANGTLWAWGSNSNGRLGDGTLIERSSPVSVLGGFTDWVSASACNIHSLGVRANGTLWAWGGNFQGRLGDGTTTARSSPVSVIGGFTDWVSARGGAFHSLGLRANGTVWTWGSNSNGELGDGTVTSRLSPVSVVGGFTDWVSIDAGSLHNLGIRSNGSLWAWGNNGEGRLGDGTITNRSSPVSVVGGFTDWVSAHGALHSLGVRANGTLWAWGRNTNGQMGNDTTTANSSPVSVVGGFTDWVSVSASRYYSLGVRA